MRDIFQANQRMVILHSLYKEPEYKLSSEMLQRVLKVFGHSCGISEVNQLIGNLELRGFLTTESLPEGIVVAQLTRSGLDVATGAVIVRGIDRPPLER